LKSKKEKYVERRKKLTTNINKILEIIGESEKSFTEIKTNVTFSEQILSKHLRYLQKEGQIEKKLDDDKKPYYVLTDKGKKIINYARIQQTNLENILKNDKIIFDGSDLGLFLRMFDLPWGIEPKLIINKKLAKLKVLKPEDVEEIEKLLFKKIMTNVEYITKYNSKYGKEALKLLEDDRFMLNFNINLENIHKSFAKKSLEVFENMTDEEIRSKFESDEELDWVAEHEDELDLVEVKKEENSSF
jgi:DNA-binding HxlR family transcriptional regulator